MSLARDDSESDEIFNEETIQAQNNILDWLTASSIFLLAAVAIKGFDQHSAYYSILFFGITGLLFGISAYTYIQDRESLRKKGLAMPGRFGILLVITVVVVIACVILMYTTYVESLEDY